MNYRKEHIDVDGVKRQGIKCNMKYLTIHSTANLNSTAQNERDNLNRKSNTRKASFHIVVDEKEAIECIPTHEKTLHAGNAKGNIESISIEICESGDRTKTIDNAAKVAASVLKDQGMTITDMLRHYDWSGKNCPRVMSANNWQGWKEFRSMVQDYLDKLNKEEVNKKQVVEKRNLILDDKLHQVDGFNIDGQVFLAARQVLELVGLSVGWSRADNAVVAGLEPIKYSLKDKEITSDRLFLNGVNYISLRKAYEDLNLKVNYDVDTKSIDIK